MIHCGHDGRTGGGRCLAREHVPVIASEGILGRDRELGVVASLVAKATAGGGALLIHGDAGIGKSALLERAVALAQAAGMRVLHGRPASGPRQTCRSPASTSCFDRS